MKLLTTTLVVCSLAQAVASEPKAWVSARINFVAGSSEDSGLPRHEHDPTDDEQYLQGLDLSFNFEAFGWLSGFTNTNTFQNEDRDLDSELEEAFLKAELPYGFELRGGRFLNRIGTQNAVHLNGWDFADANFTTSHFLGEEGLGTDSGEISWFKELDAGIFGISLAYGEILGHEEEEGEEEEEEEEEFEGNVLTARAFLRYNTTDFHQQELGINYLDSDSDSDRKLYGVDYRYTWNANGLEGGGESFTARAEYNVLDTPDDTFGSLLLSAHYRFDNGIGLHGRFEWIELDYEGETSGRERYTTAVTYQRRINEDWLGEARVQYNNNQFEGDTFHEGWVGLELSYGGREIR